MGKGGSFPRTSKCDCKPIPKLLINDAYYEFDFSWWHPHSYIDPSGCISITQSLLNKIRLLLAK